MLTECKRCGQPLLDNLEYCPVCNEANPESRVLALDYVPWWGWLFVLVNGAIPALTALVGGVGGEIPGAVIIATAGGWVAVVCARVSKNPNKSLGARLGRCATITVGIWAVFVTLVGLGIWHMESLRGR